MCGLRRFYTGRACRAGHLSERFLTNGQCVDCNAISAKRREALRSSTDAAYRLFRNVQRRTGQALQGRASPTLAVGGCVRALSAHIEDRFGQGMAWGNYRQWEVDHMLPLSGASSFDELLRRCHYTNLQPLWRRQNRMKGGA